MKNKFKKIVIPIMVTSLFFVNSHCFYNTSHAKEQSLGIICKYLTFDDKSKYDFNESTASFTTDTPNLGRLEINGDYSIDNNLGDPRYEVNSGSLISFTYNYDNTLANADDTSWHIVKDNKTSVNNIDLEDKIQNGAIILQTSLDAENWVTNTVVTDLSDSYTFSEENNSINDAQLYNGCYYRVIVAYSMERKTNASNILFIDTSDYEKIKKAEVYNFYASYKKDNTESTGQKTYFQAGFTDDNYTSKTKSNDYKGNESIDPKDPHYGWNIGSFCLSGYTRTGDSDDIYLKKAGNKVKLSFKLDQDINKLNNNENLVIASDKKGYDGEFNRIPHNMKHGELVVKYTDSEKKSKFIEYSDYLSALSSPSADTTISLFEEGDYEVHLDYAITDKKGIHSTTYYRTSFSFKIRSGNCMVYVFDAQNNSELFSGDIAPNGFRIDSAKSSYPQLTVTRKILNDSGTKIVEDTRFNGAAFDGEIYDKEGIYTIQAKNRYDDSIPVAIKNIYVGDNNMMAAITKSLDTDSPYTIETLNNMVKQGYEILNDGTIKEPVIVTTIAETTVPEMLSTSTTYSEISDNNSTSDNLSSTDTDLLTSESANTNSNDISERKTIAPITYGIAGICGISVLGVIITLVTKFSKKRK